MEDACLFNEKSKLRLMVQKREASSHPAARASLVARLRKDHEPARQGNGADKSYLIEDPAIGENFSEGEYSWASRWIACPSE